MPGELGETYGKRTLSFGVFKHVSGEVTSLTASVRAMVAGKWFFARVNSHVCQQGARSGKFCGAFITRVRFFPRVCSNMLFEIAPLITFV